MKYLKLLILSLFAAAIVNCSHLSSQSKPISYDADRAPTAADQELQNNGIAPTLAMVGKTQVNFNPSVDVSKLPQECQTFINKVLPEHQWVGGFIGVPENWQDASSRQILVFYYYNSPDTKLNKPILFLNGGPFSSYHVRMDALSKQILKYDTSSEKHTFVMMDQRGVGCSTPGLPEGKSPNILQYKLYGSQNIAHDAEAIRQKLFGKAPWKIFAQSYGGFLSARYLEYFPSSITEMHVYAPVYHESMADFFWMRTKKQNEVLQKFLDYYPNDRKKLELALQKIQSSDGQRYCIDGGDVGTKICGTPLSDVMVANIGQGRGRGQGATEVWDGVRNALVALADSDSTDSASENYKAFISSATGPSAFFTQPTIAVVFTLWSQEFPFISGQINDDCKKARSVLRQQGLDVENLLIDECRIIQNIVPASIKNEIQLKYQMARGHDYLTQKRLAKLIKKQQGMNFYLYTGELDSVAQKESLEPLVKSDATIYQNFKESGHAGWLYEPLVWQRLMDQKNL